MWLFNLILNPSVLFHVLKTDSSKFKFNDSNNPLTNAKDIYFNILTDSKG